MVFVRYTAAFALLSTVFPSQFIASASSLREVLTTTQNLTSFRNLLTGQFSSVLNALESYPEPITILAPSDNAFQRLTYLPSLSAIFNNNETARLLNLLAYHVVAGTWTSETLNGTFKFLPTLTNGTNFSMISGGQRVGAVLQGGEPEQIVFVSGSSSRSVVLQNDIPFDGGVVQVLDNFLVPPTPIVDTIETYGLANEPHAMTSFLGAIYSQPNSSLPSVLNTTSDLTIFAPVNVAMEIVSGALTTMSNSSLTNLLKFHVRPGNGTGPLYSSGFANGTSLSMLSGEAATLYTIDNSYFLDSARILTTDILVANGVIHMIDNVLNPEITTQLPNPTSATQVPVLPTVDSASFNSSMAPFTTNLPDYVNTLQPTTTSSSSSVVGTAWASASSAAATPSSIVSTSGKKSAATRSLGKSAIAVPLFWAFSLFLGVLDTVITH